MARKLITASSQGRDDIRPSKLAKSDSKFKVSIEHALHNGYCIKDLRPKGVKGLQQFLSATVEKKLTITQVDSLYLRTKGPIKDEVKIDGTKRDVVHYGIGSEGFRIHGYYNTQGYFVIWKIDPDHRVHGCK